MRSVFLLMAALCSVSVLSGDLFEKMSFEDALKKAGAENKLVFVDFFTTWCGPCKKLDKTTWKDEKVKTWLTERTIPLKIDAEIQTDLAKKYRVQSYPTLLYVKPDGSVADRITGYRTADEFIKASQDAVSGKDLLAEVEKKYKLDQSADRLDAKTFMQYTDRLVEKDRFDEAMKEYVHVLDGADKDPAKKAISFLALRKMSQLSRIYEPAEVEINRRRGELEARVDSGDITQPQLRSLITFNQVMRKADKNLALYDKMKDSGAEEGTVAFLFDMVYSELLNARRYDEILAKVSVADKITEAKETHKRMLSFTKNREGAKEMANGMLAMQLGQCYQILLGTGKGDEASKLAAEILEIKNDYEAYNSLAWSGYLSGGVCEENLKQARQAYEMSAGESAAVLDTYARVMGELGQRDKAIEMLEKAASSFTGGDRKIVEECLNDLKNSGESSES